MYHNVEEFDTALMNLSFTYPTLVELITLPFWTPGGRRVKCLRIGKNTASGRDGILIVCGQHAREWVSPEIGLNLIADLLPAYTNNQSLTYQNKKYFASEIREIIDHVNLFIIPCANPDGHAYTQSWDQSTPDTEKENRLKWRKNRNTTPQSGVIGVDLNRNYDFAFDLNKYFDLTEPRVTNNTSATPSSIVYHGPNAFSEPETQNIRWLIQTYQRIRWLVDVHAHTPTGEIYYPWGDDENQDKRPAMNWQNPEFDHQRGDRGEDTYKEYISGIDQAAHQALANRLKEGANAVRNSAYLVQQIASLYAVSGSTTDWIWSRHLVHPSLPRVEGFAIEAQGGDSDYPYQYGFQPRPAIKDLIVRDVTSGLINFSLATVCGLGANATIDSVNVVFNNIPEGRIASRPVILRVTGCWGANFRVISGPTKTSGPAGIAFGVAVGAASLPIPAGGAPVTREMYLWLTVMGGSAGQIATGTVRVESPDSFQTWDISLTANFVRAPRAGAVLILDRSGSMSLDAGDGRTRLRVLKESAPAFVEVAPPKTRVGLVRFATDASSGAAMTTMGLAGPDPGRDVILNAISNHTLASGAAGNTSIGDGVYAATQLIEPESDVEFKSLIVLTDGHENESKFLSEVSSLIHNRVFAIGLGKPHDIQPIALDALTNKTSGYMLMTGEFDGNDPYRLAKYYLQILTGVTNDQVVIDPDGLLPHGAEHKIPFYLTEADQSVDAIVLTPFPRLLKIRLLTPSGQILDGSHPSLKWTEAKQLGFFRFTLPVPGPFQKEGAGLWHLVLGWANDWRKQWDRLNHSSFFPSTASSNFVRYKAMVHAKSEVEMTATVTQNSNEGGKVNVRIRLTQFEAVPLDGATAQALIELPDKSMMTLTLEEKGNGVYQRSFEADLFGVYHMRISAEGRTLGGFPFTREAWRTARFWRGGDYRPPTDNTNGGKLVLDLLRSNAIDRDALKRIGVDVEQLAAFLKPEGLEDPIRGETPKDEGAAGRRKGRKK